MTRRRKRARQGQLMLPATSRAAAAVALWPQRCCCCWCSKNRPSLIRREWQGQMMPMVTCSRAAAAVASWLFAVRAAAAADMQGKLSSTGLADRGRQRQSGHAVVACIVVVDTMFCCSLFVQCAFCKFAAAVFSVISQAIVAVVFWHRA
jgi:hypothetical protein